jgi:hypothetical protein
VLDATARQRDERDVPTRVATIKAR